MSWRARLVCLSTGLALWSGCAEGAATPRSAAPSTAEPTAAPTRGDRCEELLQRYRTTLAARTGRCTSDEECVLTGSWDPETLCGVAADLETARAVARIHDEAMAAGCPAPGYSCPARLARCVEGACYDPAGDTGDEH